MMIENNLRQSVFVFASSWLYYFLSLYYLVPCYEFYFRSKVLIVFICRATHKINTT